MADEDNIDRSLMLRQSIRDIERMLDDISTNAKNNGYSDPVIKSPFTTTSYENKPATLTEEEAKLIYDLLFGQIYAPHRPKPRLVSMNMEVQTSKSIAVLSLIKK